MVSGPPYGSVNSKHAHPPSGNCRVFCMLLVVARGVGGGGICEKTSAIPVEAVFIVPFSIFHLKICLFR